MAPLSSLRALDELSSAGADEFYLGFFDAAWETIFGPFEELNRMSSFGHRVNFAFHSLKQVLKEVHARGKTAFITINSAAYSVQELDFIESYADELAQIGADGIILGSVALLPRLHRYRLPLTISTMGGVYNSDIAAFYRDLGVTRIILPRDLTLNDIKKIVEKFPELDFEVFLMRNGCKYSDSNCMSFHARKHGSMCATLDRAGVVKTSVEADGHYMREVYQNHTLYANAFHRNACGLCSVDYLSKIGIASVKIVGRADNPASVCDDIRKVRALIDIPGYSKTAYSENCLYHMNCYYE